MLCKPFIRILDFYDVCCYIYICTVLIYVSVLSLCVKELLQIKFCIFRVFKGVYHLTLKLFKNTKPDGCTEKMCVPYLLCNFNMVFIPVPPKMVLTYKRKLFKSSSCSFKATVYEGQSIILGIMKYNYVGCLYCGLRPSKQLWSCRAHQSPINTVTGQD